MLLQQGDVLIKSSKIPQGKKKIASKNGRLILAEGEATGHAHAIVSTDVTLFGNDEKKWLKVEKDCVVTHEEHGTITIPVGEYEIGIVQEYDHFEEEARNVVD